MREDRTEFLAGEDAELTQVDESLLDSDWNSDNTSESVTNEGDNAHASEQEEQSTATNEPKADQSFKLKYLGQELDVSRDEMITLAQKGKDYDRIRSRADALSDELQKTKLTQKSRQNLDDFIGNTKSSLSSESKASGQGSERIAGSERTLTQKPPSEPLRTDVDARERRSREVAEFMSEYGSVEPRTIPREVWDSVRSGKTLLGAYQSYENKSLKARILAERKNLLNAQKTVGSRKSSGGLRVRGAIEDDWYKED